LSFWWKENKENVEFMLNKLEDPESTGDLLQVSSLVSEVLTVTEVILIF